METLESSRVCRLCGQHSGISINIFDENENHIRKINAVLPIMVHEMDLLPKQMCHRCSYKLEEFHKFYVNCLKTDAALKSQLSWMRKSQSREKIGVPMVHIENVKIKAEPLDYDVFELQPLVENIGGYINSMAFTAPADGIHDELTYATFSRCRCYCDKKDQSRSGKTEAEFCHSYEEPVSKCSEIADTSRTLQDTATRLKPIARKTLLSGCLPNRLSSHAVNVAEDAQVRLTFAADSKQNNASSLEARNHFYDRSRTVSAGQTSPRSSTIVRNLRPRKNLVSYTQNKKGLSSVSSKLAATSALNVPNPRITLATVDLVSTRQIKQERMEDFERRSLRPRKSIVYYQEPKVRKVLEHRAERCKVGKSGKPYAKDKDAPGTLNLKIKQEILEDRALGGTPSATCRLTRLADLPAKVEAPSDAARRYLGTSEKKSLTNIVRNGLARTSRKMRFPANYSPKCLRSQDAYLRNGKTRNKNNYAGLPARRLQKKRRRLMLGKDAVGKDARNVPAIPKLIDSIKHYCDACDVSFANMELFRLHVCYFD